MDIKRVIRIATTLCTAALMGVACSSDTPTSPAVVAGDSMEVTFRLGLPPGDEVEYRAVQEGDETVINRLRMYDFVAEAAGDTVLVAVHVLSKSSESSLPLGCFNSAGEVRVALSAKNGNARVFAFVANDDMSGFAHKIGETTPDDLRNAPASKVLATGEGADVLLSGGAVMTGMSVVENIENEMKVSVSMSRIVACMDVVNKVSAARNFVLQQVSMENCASVGYLFKQTATQGGQSGAGRGGAV